MFEQTKVNLKHQCYTWKWFLTCTYEIYKVNTRSKTWNLHVIDMILSFKRTDFFTLCPEKSCVSLLIIHFDLAWYIVEYWPRHFFDHFNNGVRILHKKLHHLQSPVQVTAAVVQARAFTSHPEDWVLLNTWLFMNRGE